MSHLRNYAWMARDPRGYADTQPVPVYGTRVASTQAARPAGNSHWRLLPDMTPPKSKASIMKKISARISRKRDAGQGMTLPLPRYEPAMHSERNRYGN